MDPIRVNVEIEQADRGFVVRHSFAEGAGSPDRAVTIIEGQLGSANLQDRVRRHVTGLMRRWFPDGRTAATEPAGDGE